tara:strand:- start:67 stop:720 length:654 start_codon:yes stop_codon:yes gene_type:complete
MKLFYLKSNLPKTDLAPNYKYVILESQLKDTNLILLKDEILNREKQITDGKDISLSRYRFFNNEFWHRPIIKSLENEIKEYVLKYLNYQLLEVPNDLYISAWVNVMRKEQKIDIHQHDHTEHSFISGNICVTTQNTKTHYINPYNYFTLEKQAHHSDNLPGKVTIFPSTLPHYTDQYEGDKERITMAFDIFVKDHTTITEKWGKQEFFGENIKKLDI